MGTSKVKDRMASISNLPPRGVIAAEMLWRKAQSFRQDPLGFVLWAYTWGKPGPLEKYDGPDEWQAEFLRELGEEGRKSDSTT